MSTTRSATALLDTNILVRASVVGDPDRQLAIDAIGKLEQAGVVLFICPQNMQEFRQVATRPSASNGLGWSSEDTASIISQFEQRYTLVTETARIYPTWRRIVEATQAMGRANFDARLVAIAELAEMESVVTFEARAFARYAAEAPGLKIVHPRDV